jgi:hypothetical protein
MNMDKTRRFSPPTGLPTEDDWLDRLTYRRLLSVSASLLIAVKSPDSDLRKALNIARSVPRKERLGEHASAARLALLQEVKLYLARHRHGDPSQGAEVSRPDGQGIPAFTQDGTLPPGFWHVTPAELIAALAFNAHRQEQVKLLFRALTMLKAAGCKKVTIGGSFASRKPKPSDIDLIWDTDGLDESKLDPVFVTGSGLERQELFGIDAFPLTDAWKLKLCLVQSLWGSDSPEPHELPADAFASLPRFRAVGVLVLDLSQALPGFD